MRLCMAAAAVGLLATLAQAQVWNEIPDAPELIPGQITTGTGPLTAITGDIVAGGNDFVDAFCIRITDPAAFSASTINAATTVSDTQLWLFDANGLGVTFNDDDPGGSGTHSRITGAFVPGSGIYMIAVSGYNTDPINAAGALIWNNTPFNVERPPDGPGAPGPLAAWAHDSFAPTGHYQIDLTGCTYCVVPSPGSLAFLGLAGLVGLRRRR